MKELKDVIKRKRLALNYSQVELAKPVGVSDRTIQNYELGQSKPRSISLLTKLANALQTTPEELIGDKAELHILEAYEKGGAKASRDVGELLGEVTGLFAGGQLDDDALDGIMKALSEAYWIAKEENKKYGKRKKRTAETEKTEKE